MEGCWPFDVFTSFMLPIHLAIGLVEGLITSAILCFIYEVRTDILWLPDKEMDSTNKKKYFSLKSIIVIFAIAALIVGGGLSLVASANPDGLEWSIENITGSTELESKGGAYEIAEKIQGATALLPDYSLKDSDSAADTSIAGVLGGIVVLAVCMGAAAAVRVIGRKHQNE